MKVWAILIALLALSACEQQKPYETRPPMDGQTDWCGFTWRKTAPASIIITIQHTPDWQMMPGTCRQPGIRGCADSSFLTNGDRVTAIHLINPVDLVAADRGQCNTLTHELLHAMGYSHDEAHGAIPRDMTR